MLRPANCAASWNFQATARWAYMLRCRPRLLSTRYLCGRAQRSPQSQSCRRGRTSTRGELCGPGGRCAKPLRKAAAQSMPVCPMLLPCCMPCRYLSTWQTKRTQPQETGQEAYYNSAKSVMFQHASQEQTGAYINANSQQVGPTCGPCMQAITASQAAHPQLPSGRWMHSAGRIPAACSPAYHNLLCRCWRRTCMA